VIPVDDEVDQATQVGKSPHFMKEKEKSSEAPGSSTGHGVTVQPDHLLMGGLDVPIRPSEKASAASSMPEGKASISGSVGGSSKHLDQRKNSNELHAKFVSYQKANQH